MNTKLKKILVAFTGISAVIAFAVCTFFNAQKEEKKQSDIIKANIEALSYFEFDYDLGGWTCFEDVKDDTSSEVFFITIRCEDCYTVSATSVKDPERCMHK